MSEDRLLTEQEAAERIGVPVAAVRNMRLSGLLPMATVNPDLGPLYREADVSAACALDAMPPDTPAWVVALVAVLGAHKETMSDLEARVAALEQALGARRTAD